ncbi:MAG: type 1 glutamine amidotransferase [Coriobacteriia bacterium]|nr:type 1 glutamine amidotransferase [Coriobacteriia bacterium]
MRIHVIQHVPFEGPAGIAEWADARGHALTVTLAPTAAFASPADYDLIVVMGGPMNIYEVDLYPWLSVEKDVIAEAIKVGKGVLGVCLGAQLVADVLGGSVGRNEVPEVGWYPVELTGAGTVSRVFGVMPERFVAGHWHWDTFEIPQGAVHTASSKACVNQAFEYDDGRVIGVQFHLEWTREVLAELIERAGEELTEDVWVQTEGELIAPDAPFAETGTVLEMFLDALERRTMS